MRECAVVGVDHGGFDGTVVAAAYVADGEQRPAAVRRALAAALPTYMLPAQWLALDALPKNDNGKVDRPELRRRFARLRSEREERRR